MLCSRSFGFISDQETQGPCPQSVYILVRAQLTRRWEVSGSGRSARALALGLGMQRELEPLGGEAKASPRSGLPNGAKSISGWRFRNGERVEVAPGSQVQGRTHLSESRPEVRAARGWGCLPACSPSSGLPEGPVSQVGLCPPACTQRRWGRCSDGYISGCGRSQYLRQ